ncbi:L-fucose/L-arabinose isomerase family protein [Tessaracoccus sp.]
MEMNKVRLALCPVGKFVFSHDDAVRQKKSIQARLDALEIDFVDLDQVFPETEGLIEDISQVPAAVAHFREHGVDALFLPHCNFGTEGAAGLMARDLGVPTLLWGPRDAAPEEDGTRLRDTLCGLFASSKVVRKLVGNRFTYLENCGVDEQTFTDGLQSFLRTAAIVGSVSSLRIGLIGARVPFFWSCIIDEGQLLERFGIEVLPYEIATFLNAVERRMISEAESLGEELAAIEERWLDATGCDRTELLRGVAAARELLFIARRDGIGVLAVQIFDTISEALGSGAAIYIQIVSAHIPVSIESDVHGAVSLALMQAARTNTLPPFFPEFVIRDPDDDNRVCLWHVGSPPALRNDADEKLTIRRPWILPGEKPNQAQMRLRDGAVTICRFDGDGGQYRLGLGSGHVEPGPYTRDDHGWLRVNNWQRWERQLVEGPYIHHVAAAYDADERALMEACKYLGIDVEVFGNG